MLDHNNYHYNLLTYSNHLTSHFVKLHLHSTLLFSYPLAYNKPYHLELSLNSYLFYIFFSSSKVLLYNHKDLKYLALTLLLLPHHCYDFFLFPNLFFYLLLFDHLFFLLPLLYFIILYINNSFLA